MDEIACEADAIAVDAEIQDELSAGQIDAARAEQIRAAIVRRASDIASGAAA